MRKASLPMQYSALRQAVFAGAHRDPAVAASRATDIEECSSFAINGRFLMQTTTGVQRYAREIVTALDGVIAERQADIVVPVEAKDDLPLRRITPLRLGAGAGHIWEQVWLPRCGKPLLNLCNSAPFLGWNECVCIHDANVFDVPESYAPRFRLAYRTLHPLIARSATTVTTVSNYSARRISRHLGLTQSRIVIAPNGHEHARRWRPERATVPQIEGRPYVLLLGSLARHKNIDRILGLAEAIDSLGLDIRVAGTSSSVLKHQVNRRAKNIHLLGHVTDDDLAALLRSALCLAFPSLCEGFGLPMIEAMVWNCPVIASNAASLPEVGGNACLYADPNDDAEWLSKLAALRGSSSLRSDLAGRGRERTKRFSWAESACRYLEVMTSSRRLIGRRRAA